MGKNLKGKEFGRGIDQKDGRYRARFTDAQGKSHEKYFRSVPAARNWIEGARYEAKHGPKPAAPFTASVMTVDDSFEKAIEQFAQYTIG